MRSSALLYFIILFIGIYGLLLVDSHLKQISEDNEYLIEVGSSANIPCNIHIRNGVNVWTVEWRKRKYFSEASETVYIFNSSSSSHNALNSWSKRDIKLNTSTPFSSVHIPVVHINDTGFYDCLITINSEEAIAKAVHLNVYDKTNDNVLSPNGLGFVYVVEVGSSAAIPCDTFLKPELVIKHVQWIKRTESNNLTEVVYNFSGNINHALNSWINKNITLNNSLPTLVMSIQKVAWMDNGLLDCKVTYSTGAIKTSTVRLRVFGQGWISITCSPEKNVITLYDSVSCICTAERIDPVPVQGFFFSPKDSTGLKTHHGHPRNSSDSLIMNITWDNPRTKDIVLECSLAVTESNDTYQGNMTALYIIKVSGWASGSVRSSTTTVVCFIIFLIYMSLL